MIFTYSYSIHELFVGHHQGRGLDGETQRPV